MRKAMSGWIKLHRQIRNHWVFRNANYFKAWVVIISEVNHQSSKVLIEGELIGCKRGQSINSLATWVNILGDDWTIQKLRTFLKLLEKDGMINTEGLRKTTRLTVCNYDSYQSEQQADNKETTNSQQADNTQLTTNKNVKNEKEENKINIEERKQAFAQTLNPYLEKYGREFLNDFYLYWTEPTLNNKKLKYELEKTWSLDRRLSTWESNAKKYGTVLPKKNNEQWKPEWL